MLFKLNNVDYTAHIVADTYKINKQPVYETYEDAKGQTHNVKIRDKVKGTFDMFFKTMTEYNTFVSNFNAGRSLLTNAHAVTLKPNTSNSEGLYQCYLKYEPTRKLKGTYQEYMSVFTVTVEER